MAKKLKAKHQPTRAAMNREHAMEPSATKSGPGRYHSAGHAKASPHKSKGAPSSFVLHTNPEKRQRRELIALHGRRQFLKACKVRRAEYAAAQVEAQERAQAVAHA